MADQNIKQFTISWILFGLLFFSLIIFAITFMANNNPAGNGLGDAQSIFLNVNATLSGRLLKMPDEGNTLLNITSKTNPEVSFLGSRDSTASAYSLFGNGKGFFESSKIWIKWIFSGFIGDLLLAVFGGLLSIAGLYWIFKYIRTGT